MSRTFTIQELCAESAKSPRTIRLYVKKDLLASPGRGAKGGYPPDSLDRLALVERFLRQGKTLDGIAELLKGMSQGEIAQEAKKSREEEAIQESEATGLNSAADYIAELKQRQGAAVGPRNSSELQVPTAAQWQRYALSEDVELNVRSPLDATRKRQIERLLRSAARILSEEP